MNKDEIVLSNAWDWTSVEDKDYWMDPSDEGYFYCNKWKREGKRRVLDLGCGLGRHSVLFAENGFDVTAIDTSKIAVDHLNRHCLEHGLVVHTEVCDMHELPFDNESFDCLFAFHSISHTDSNGIRRILSEISRVLIPGGSMFMTLCSKETWSFKEADLPILDECTRIKTEGKEKGIPHVYVDRDNIIELMSGFELKRVRHIDDCFFQNGWRNSKHYFIEAVRR